MTCLTNGLLDKAGILAKLLLDNAVACDSAVPKGVTCRADLEEIAQLQPAGMLQVMLSLQGVIHVLQTNICS